MHHACPILKHSHTLSRTLISCRQQSRYCRSPSFHHNHIIFIDFYAGCGKTMVSCGEMMFGYGKPRWVSSLVVVKRWWVSMPDSLLRGNGIIFRNIYVCGRVWAAHRTLEQRKKFPLETPYKVMIILQVKDLSYKSWMLLIFRQLNEDCSCLEFMQVMKMLKVIEVMHTL